MTDRTLIDRARAAVPNWVALNRARRDAASTRATVRDTRTDGGTGALVSEIVDLLAAGRDLPTNLAERAHQARTTAAQRRADTLTVLAAAEAELHERADRALSDGVDDALGVLRAELAELIDRSRPALAVLGDIADAGAAIDAGTETAEAWRTVSAAAAAYVDLRRAHARLVHEAVVGTRAERDRGQPTPMWGVRRLRPEAATAVARPLRRRPRAVRRTGRRCADAGRTVRTRHASARRTEPRRRARPRRGAGPPGRGSGRARGHHAAEPVRAPPRRG